MTVPLVLDTDIGSDVDDALALALALRHPELDLRAVTTVSCEPEARARMAARLLAVAGAPHVEVAAGVHVAGDERNTIGDEMTALAREPGLRLSERDGITVLAHVEAGTVIATIGQQSNLAAALTLDASLPARVELLAVMGGAFAAIETRDGRRYGPERDWNLVLDPTGAVAALSSAWRALYVPIDVTARVTLRRDHVDRLRGGDELCRTLAVLVDAWRARGLERADAPELADVACFLHDPLAVACVVDRSFVRIERLPVTVGLDRHGRARTFVDPVCGDDADVVRSVDAAAFADWLVDVLLTS